MSGPTIFHGRRFLLILVVLLLAPSKSKTKVGVEGFSIRPKTHVEIFNYLEHHQVLTLHCKSKDDDLQVQRLNYGEKYEFSFHENFFETTLFYCSFQWVGSSIKWFDIYVGSRDDPVCDTRVWGIYEDHPCMLNTGDDYDPCYHYH